MGYLPPVIRAKPTVLFPLFKPKVRTVIIAIPAGIIFLRYSMFKPARRREITEAAPAYRIRRPGAAGKHAMQLA